MRYIDNLSVLLFLSAAAACSEREVVSTAETPIKGGNVDTQDVAVVGIFDNGTSAECSGSLIAPKLVLTAQHCVAMTPQIMDCRSEIFGALRPARELFVTTRPSFTFEVSDYHAVAEVVLPPGEQHVCGQDVALLVLQRAIASSEALPLEARTSSAPFGGETYSAVGYGATSSVAGAPSGARRRRDGLVVSCVGTDCPAMFAASEWRGDQGTCGGDSGGPALDSRGRVIGVLSRAAYDCSSPVYGLLTSYADWIAAEIARASGVVPDAGMIDSGAIDAGARDVEIDPREDAATPADAQMSTRDAEAVIRADAAVSVGPMREDGCGCTAAPARSSWGVIALLFVLALSRQRRRHVDLPCRATKSRRYETAPLGATHVAHQRELLRLQERREGAVRATHRARSRSQAHRKRRLRLRQQPAGGLREDSRAGRKMARP